jgi:hypothetical protein
VEGARLTGGENVRGGTPVGARNTSGATVSGASPDNGTATMLVRATAPIQVIASFIAMIRTTLFQWSAEPAVKKDHCRRDA